MKSALIILATLFLAVNGGKLKSRNLKEFNVINCNPSDPIQIEQLSIEPDPIVIPGSVTYSITISGTVPVVSPTAGDILLEFRPDAASEFTALPCEGTFGSCQFTDVCTEFLDVLFPGECPQSFLDNNVPCHCPFDATTYTIPPTTAEFPDPLLVPSGDYHLRTTLSNADGELQCFEVYITIQENI